MTERGEAEREGGSRLRRAEVMPWVLACLVACGSGGGFPDAPPPDGTPANARFSLQWTVTDAANQPIGCDRIFAQGVTVLAHNQAVEGGNTQVFTCVSGMGTSEGMPPGIYDFGFELDGDPNVVQAPGGVLAIAPTQSRIPLVNGETVALAPLTFVVDATGALALTLSSGATGGNCAATNQNGAGIVATTITMTHASDGTCNPITLNIAAGATQPASTYTINCTTPVQGPCIESDQLITASGVPSDSYVIHVRGKLNGSAGCWFNNDSLPVPPLGETLTRTLNMAMGSGGQCT